MATARRPILAGAEPLSPRRKWRAITLATLALIPVQWGLLAGLVSLASDDPRAPLAAPFIAFGLVLIPFVFVLLAFLSEHPKAAAAVAKAMALFLLVGIPISALAADAVTGLVAAVGAGGVVALRADPGHASIKARWLAVFAVTVYVFILLRTVGDVALLLAPALPFTAIGVSDHLVERRAERRMAQA
jgi:hypothetical protein